MQAIGSALRVLRLSLSRIPLPVTPMCGTGDGRAGLLLWRPLQHRNLVVGVGTRLPRNPRGGHADGCLEIEVHQRLRGDLHLLTPRDSIASGADAAAGGGADRSALAASRKSADERSQHRPAAGLRSRILAPSGALLGVGVRYQCQLLALCVRAWSARSRASHCRKSGPHP